MKFSKSAFISSAIVILTFILCFIFRAVPVSKIWDSYSVVYVDKSYPEYKVLNLFSQYGIEGILSLGQQKVPFVSDFTPILPQEMNSYLLERLAYFQDYNENYRLYYVPRGNDSACEKVLEEIIRTTNSPCGLDGKQQYPWVVPLVTLLVFLVFLYFSRNKAAFVFSTLNILVLSFSQVFYPVASACILYMLSCYLSSRLWGRKLAVHVLKRNLYAIIPILVSVIVVMIMSVQCAVLILLCCASSVCSLIVLDSWQKYVDSKSSLKIVNIFSARQLPIMHPVTAKHTLFCLVPLVVLLVVFLITSRVSNGSDSSVTIPVPVENEAIDLDSEKTLPGLKDFYNWSWNIKSFPYRNLNLQYKEQAEDGDTVTIPRYEISGDKIIETQSVLMTFNDEFRDKADREIDSLEYGAIEKLMKKQGGDFTVVYRSSSDSRGKTDGLGLVLILVCLFVPVLLLMIYVVKSGRKYR